jgi:hypothetical protein
VAETGSDVYFGQLLFSDGVANEERIEAVAIAANKTIAFSPREFYEGRQ